MNSTGGGPSNPWSRPSRLEVLAVDDDPGILSLIRVVLSSLAGAIEIHVASGAERAEELMRTAKPGLVFLDLVMPDVNGFDLLDRLIRIDPYAEIILLTGHYSMDSAVEAIQRGASDYLTKPVSPQRLRSKVENWLKLSQAQDRAFEADPDMVRTFEFEGIIGRSPQIVDLFSRITRIAPHFSNALVVGGTGTGKELVARTLHRLGSGPAAPFVVFNCAAVTETLYESALFGHVRGAFTGAVNNHKGLIETAAGGTLFMDEIGETPPGSQAKLLRFLQNREIQPLGTSAVRRVNVRVVAATNRSLADMAAARTFREDLYYRLASVTLHVPRLSQRREDIPLLVRHFLNLYAKQFGRPPLRLSRRARAFMLRYPWPGNVRELESSLSYGAMMTESDIVDLQHLPGALLEAVPADCGLESEILPLEVVERRYVMEVLARLNGNRAKAAEALGIGRTTLYRILKHDYRWTQTGAPDEKGQ